MKWLVVICLMKDRIVKEASKTLALVLNTIKVIQVLLVRQNLFEIVAKSKALERPYPGHILQHLDQYLLQNFEYFITNLTTGVPRMIVSRKNMFFIKSVITVGLLNTVLY